MKCVVTGSFDPITKGHIFIIREALKRFDEVIVAVMNNENKKYMFNMEERVIIAKKSLEDIANVKVFGYDGYAIDFCKEHGIRYVFRGFRNSADYEYETVMAKWNKEHGDVDTILVPCDKEYQDISATHARENIANEIELEKVLDYKTIEVIKELKKNGK